MPYFWQASLRWKSSFPLGLVLSQSDHKHVHVFWPLTVYCRQVLLHVSVCVWVQCYNRVVYSFSSRAPQYNTKGLRPTQLVFMFVLLAACFFYCTSSNNSMGEGITRVHSSNSLVGRIFWLGEWFEAGKYLRPRNYLRKCGIFLHHCECI